MVIRVTKADIEAGRYKADQTCGCPIWHALNRQLALNLTTIDNSIINVARESTAFVRGLQLNLPKEAVEMQKLLRHVPTAPVKPFSFEAELANAK